jgi:hypothetical protein
LMNLWLDDERVAVENWMVATSSADVPLAAAAAKLLLVLVLVLLLLLLQAWAAGPLRISTACGPKHLHMPTLNVWTMPLVAVEDWMSSTSSTAKLLVLVLLLLLLLLQAWAWAYCYCCCWCCYCCCWAGEASALPWVFVA